MVKVDLVITGISVLLVKGFQKFALFLVSSSSVMVLPQISNLPPEEEGVIVNFPLEYSTNVMKKGYIFGIVKSIS